MDLGIAAELMSVDGAKSNGQVERRIALVMEGALTAWKAFPTLFPGIDYPAVAVSFPKMWAESCRWAAGMINFCAEVTKEDKRSPELKLYGKRVTFPATSSAHPGVSSPSSSQQQPGVQKGAVLLSEPR